MADSWIVTFFLDWHMNPQQMELVKNEIPRSLAVPGDNGTCVSTTQGAPTGLDAVNRVGSQLRKLLDRSKLGVSDVKVRPA